jgi:hypothetical protein
MPLKAKILEFCFYEHVFIKKTNFANPLLRACQWKKEYKMVTLIEGHVLTSEKYIGHAFKRITDSTI